mmetsp:Transcript_11068/g.29503  ORF Transcript_11068/g.29503 Transcript_11068/m.29503 type:complete len:260 (-) Transcript_11068:761-1540(-)
MAWPRISESTKPTRSGGRTSTHFCSTWLAWGDREASHTWPCSCSAIASLCGPSAASSAPCTTRQPPGLEASGQAEAVTHSTSAGSCEASASWRSRCPCSMAFSPSRGAGLGETSAPGASSAAACHAGSMPRQASPARGVPGGVDSGVGGHSTGASGSGSSASRRAAGAVSWAAPALAPGAAGPPPSINFDTAACAAGRSPLPPWLGCCCGDRCCSAAVFARSNLRRCRRLAPVRPVCAGAGARRPAAAGASASLATSPS